MCAELTSRATGAKLADEREREPFTHARQCRVTDSVVGIVDKVGELKKIPLL